MFLLNNCKLLIFSDVRNGPCRLTKTPGIGELWCSKRCPWVHVRVHVLQARSGERSVCAGREDGLGAVRLRPAALPGLRGRRDLTAGRPWLWGAASMQKCSQTVTCYLATKYQLKHRRKLGRNARGKSLNPVYT